ncbi:MULTISPECIES: fumarylacetoacetate hydrolase family protein [unclassified Beijerinckia]|uniref:fumarylacetoacetate hydrolase family protein n=1 Tax=unclassified Beijerinckia TaxID=2638183 RepID=UPI0008996193|nr:MULTISPECIES: fumarylacetoacetate hydrolase family protein [unclassified Beijerinckia]MDH7796612.1 2,4-diketo-3-deoxy-L-fuconate hydrolase [Beijerinckia sp. GAS462]SEC52495.1 2-keto-4-pentenoate hydratase/2-oxohepta-3-ene-1,7-dioic acid hydratase (catechol pathway) [Beijerinckia sp. 28-YEA-48]
MRICRFDADRLGIVIGNKVHDVSVAQDEIRKSARYDMMGDAVIAALPQWRERLEVLAKATPGKPISEVKLLPPVARFSKVMAAPTNYHDHINEMAARQGMAVEAHRGIQAAGIFLKANSSVVGPSGVISLRFPERLNEHELEVVMIIGKAGTNISMDKALDHVAGYCMGLDMTVRGKEDRSFRKSVDGYSPIGPWMVTADEISDPDNLDIELTVNGVTKQKSNTKHLIYNCRKLIEFASSYYTLQPGDLFFTGTPAGVSPVQPGDWISAASPKLGELRIQAVAQA